MKNGIKSIKQNFMFFIPSNTLSLFVYLNRPNTAVPSLLTHSVVIICDALTPLSLSACNEVKVTYKQVLLIPFMFSYHFLYFLDPLIFATNTFIIVIISFVNSSVRVSFIFLFNIIIFPCEYLSIIHSIKSYPKRVNLSLYAITNSFILPFIAYSIIFYIFF